MKGQKSYVQPKQVVRVELPHSEVCLHMQVAGKWMDAYLTEGGRGVQLQRDDGTPFSFPIGLGEAGFFTDENGVYTYLNIY